MAIIERLAEVFVAGGLICGILCQVAFVGLSVKMLRYGESDTLEERVRVLEKKIKEQEQVYWIESLQKIP